MKKAIKTFNWFAVAAPVLVKFILIDLESGTLMLLRTRFLWNDTEMNSKKCFKCGEH